MKLQLVVALLLSSTTSMWASQLSIREIEFINELSTATAQVLVHHPEREAKAIASNPEALAFILGLQLQERSTSPMSDSSLSELGDPSQCSTNAQSTYSENKWTPSSGSFSPRHSQLSKQVKKYFQEYDWENTEDFDTDTDETLSCPRDSVASSVSIRDLASKPAQLLGLVISMKVKSKH